MSGAEIVAEVAAALAEAGAEVGSGEYTVTLVQRSGGPSTPWQAGAPTETEIELLAVVGSYSRNLVDGTLIRADDLMVMAEAGKAEPSTADRLKIDGVEHEIVSVMPLKPADTVLAWELQCRR